MSMRVDVNLKSGDTTVTLVIDATRDDGGTLDLHVQLPGRMCDEDRRVLVRALYQAAESFAQYAAELARPAEDGPPSEPTPPVR